MSANLLADVLIGLVTLIMSLSVHEWAHAMTAFWLGDDTASRQGRLTLNPLSHIDPVGSLLLPILMMVTTGGLLGWARPVPFDPARFTRKLRVKTSTMLTAAAGPISNLVLAVLAALGLSLAGVGVLSAAEGTTSAAIRDLLLMMVHLNVVLFILNLVPFPPLDGHKVLVGLLPDSPGRHLDEWLHRNAGIASVGLLAVLFLGGQYIFALAQPITRVILLSTGVI